MGKAQRDKGANYEREIARRLRSVFPNAMRNVTETQTGQGVDLTGTGNLRIQCKRHKAYAPISRLEEVPKTPGVIPVLVTKGDRQPDVAVLYLDDLLRILEDIGIVYVE